MSTCGKCSRKWRDCGISCVTRQPRFARSQQRQLRSRPPQATSSNTCRASCQAGRQKRPNPYRPDPYRLNPYRPYRHLLKTQAGPSSKPLQVSPESCMPWLRPKDTSVPFCASVCQYVLVNPASLVLLHDWNRLSPLCTARRSLLMLLSFVPISLYR